jgi:hypothetical protein
MFHFVYRSLCIFLAIFVLFACASVALAEDTTSTVHPWKIDLLANLGVAQSSFSNNWVGGQAGSIVWVSDLDAKADKQLADAWFWGNELKLQFGQSHTQDKTTKHWAPPQKSADRIRYDGIVRYTRHWAVDPYVAGTFESQFYDATDTTFRRYLNPIETTESFGAARTLVNVPDRTVLSTRIGVAAKQRFIMVTDTTGMAVGTPNGGTLHQSTNDGGAEWVTDLALGSAKTRFSMNSKLSVFQSVVHSRSPKPVTPENDFWKTPTVNWDNVLHANVTSIIQVSLAWQLIYEKPISLAGRFRESLSLGLSYKFANHSEAKK